MMHKHFDELKLGDVVRLFDGAYGDATVRDIRQPMDGGEKNIVLFRLYVHTPEFSYSGGVIVYIGTEEITIYNSDALYHVVENGRP